VDELEQAGLRASVLRAESATVPEGHVSAQDPVAGTEVGPGETIAITVSLGSGLIELQLPDLTVRIADDDGVVPSCQDDGSCLTTVTFTVINQSKVDVEESFDVLVSADSGDQQRVAFPDGLAAGHREPGSTQLKTTPESEFTVEVDPDGRIPESDEQNNVATWARPGIDVVIPSHLP
jgi:PASTA domain/CARDB